MRVGFTGTSYRPLTQFQSSAFIRLMMQIQPSEFHFGDCINADHDAFNLIIRYFPSCKTICHPPLHPSRPELMAPKRARCQAHVILEPYDYLVRNRHIVDKSEMLVACPKSHSEELRSGTWATIRYARSRFRHVEILYPSPKESIVSRLMGTFRERQSEPSS